MRINEVDARKMAIELIPNFIIAEEDSNLLQMLLNSLTSYISTSGVTIAYIESRIKLAYDFLNVVEIEPSNLTELVADNPTFLNNEFEYKLIILYALLARIKLPLDRAEYFVKHSKDLRFSLEKLYARFCYLNSETGKSYMRKKEVTIHKLTRSASEFKDTYKMTDEQLLKLYPLTNEACLEIIGWPENKTPFEKSIKSQEAVHSHD